MENEFELVTYIVEWDQWSLDRYGDWGFDTKYEYFTSESDAIHYCEQLKKMGNRKITNIRKIIFI